jgi:peptide/nickel transport system ATP-binding protein
MSTLEVRDLCKSFPGMSHKAVDHVSFTVETGTCLGIVGGSGSGKSTVARLALGLIPADSGDVCVDGRSVLGKSGRAGSARGNLVQMVFQDHADAFNPRLTLGASVREFGIIAGLGKAEATKRSEELFERVGLDPSMLSRRPQALSGGQRQRAAIARALMSDPQFLVCDEITSALDVSLQAGIVNLLKEIAQTKGVVFITHDLALLDIICDEVMVMHEGRVVEQGPAHQVTHHPKDAYTQLLISSILPVPHVRDDARVDQPSESGKN